MARSKTETLVDLLEGSPFRGPWLAERLGLSLPMWYQVRGGYCKLTEPKARLLSKLLGIPLARVQAAAEESRKR